MASGTHSGIQPADLGFFSVLASAGSLSSAARELGITTPAVSKHLVQCADLFCTYPAAVAKAALARVTLARMSLALAVQINGLGSML